MKYKLIIYKFSISIVLLLFSCKKETVRPIQTIQVTPVIVGPNPLLSSELIYPEIEWGHWHSPNDPDHIFDELYLWIKDSTNAIPNYTTPSMEVWAKRDSTSKWERAIGTVTPGTAWPRYTYNLYPDRLVIFNWDPFDSTMIGKKGWAMIRF